MQTVSDKPSAVGTDLLPVLAGAAAAVSGVGITLALMEAHSPLRAPFVLFSLFAGPACGLAAALPRRLDAATRAATASAGALLIDLAAGHAVVVEELLTAGQAVVAVAALTALTPLAAAARRRVRDAESNGRPISSRLIASDREPSEFDQSVPDSIPNSVSEK
ncbi:hypothetical protein QCN29_22345 [Streptomyces sp. HNM0663]|uniref:Integral membrane protein n=1 Tax=Streptomyces chengmaiensis TaxID=3040919 RepID=A0ABT6HRY1_9ACTN|nr:hypothetical protein [Streptomyces chengmaiensis]MDH2391469.1 hypothetical protein [Streptomyces chengmaiensis]